MPGIWNGALAGCCRPAASIANWFEAKFAIVQLAATASRLACDKAPYAFTGTVKKVVFDLKPPSAHEDEKALHEHHTKVAVAQGIHG